MKQMNRHPLGEDQIQALQEMSDLRGFWRSGCGWYIMNTSRTVQIMESLEARGLVRREGPTWSYPGEFHLVDEGRAALAHARRRKKQQADRRSALAPRFERSHA